MKHKFNFLIFYCANRTGKMIERIYIFLEEEILKRTTIKITKGSSRKDNGMNNIESKMKKLSIK